MNRLNRRSFVQMSAGVLVSASSARLPAEDHDPSIIERDGRVLVSGVNYTWEYKRTDDSITLHDSQGRIIVRGTNQAAVVVTNAGKPGARTCTGGKVSGLQVDRGRVVIGYDGVNGSARLTSVWRFDAYGIWMEPLVYEMTEAHDIVSLHYFASSDGVKATPTLRASFLVVPGVSMSAAVGAVQHNGVHLDQSVWLGRGSFIPGLSQQWALPVHYFCGFTTPYPGPERELYTRKQSEAFVCGLADLPGGDLFLQIDEGFCSPWIDYRGDIWKHMRGPGKMTLGATWLWAVAPNYYQAIGAYYDGLVSAGVIEPAAPSPAKAAVTLTPQFCTWGAQRERDKTSPKLDQAFLETVYGEMKASGMRAGLFSIDDKWESSYGTLEHSAERFPRFEQFLAKVRGDGLKIGMWAALMRCERPADLGLTEEHMLQRIDGKPFLAGDATPYYLLDFTQPLVADVLQKIVKRFIRRYQPDLFKFDFGYELPAMGVAAPKDLRYAGERLMRFGLDVVISAMKEEKPDLVVMYYNLSPLFLKYFDLHSTDDLVLNFAEYDVEANRRMYFSSLLGRLGVPTYGSTGYDWASAPHIWFDSAAVGTIGSLNDFGGDEQGEVATPELIAKYNGVAKVLRASTKFEIVPLGGVLIAATLGAHARSWARFESGKLVLMAYRPYGVDEESPLAAGSEDARIIDAVRSEGPVIVASRDSEAITRSTRLRIVFYGAGPIDIQRSHGSTAAILCHYFGGATIASKAAVADGRLKFRVEIGDRQRHPLEWVDVVIS